MFILFNLKMLIMKHSIQILFVAFLFIASCNNKPQKVTETTKADTTKTAENKVMIPTATCYSFTTSKDTVMLKVEVFPNVVTGKLTYKLKEKDSNTGEIDGKMNGDTLLADYKFMSEGTMSTRQVIFLIKGDVATEGYGNLEEKDGRMFFKNVNEVVFGKGIILKKVACGEF